MKNRVRRLRHGCIWSAVLVLLSLFLACVGLPLLVHKALAQAGVSATDARPLDVVLAIDHSNSMWELGGTGSDPGLLRVDAANLFVSYLGLDTGAAAPRLSVIHFGATARLIVPLSSLDTPEQRASIRQAIADPPHMGGTDPLAALTLAYEALFEGPLADASRRPVVILLSDGKPEVPLCSTATGRAAYLAELREWVDRFAQQSCPVFTVALSNTATDADPDIQTVYRNLWQEVAARTPPAEYHEARQAQDLLRIYHDIVARISGAEVQPPIVETEVTGPVSYHVPVEEGLARLTLVLLKGDPTIQARVLRPEGLALCADDPDVRYVGAEGPAADSGPSEEVWSINQPRAGDWMVELDGWGHVLVWKDVALLPAVLPAAPPYTVDPLSPSAYAPDDRTLLLSARLRDQAGQPPGASAIQVAFDLRRAGFSEAMFLARDDGTEGDVQAGDGIWSAQYQFPAPGVYGLHVSIIAGGQVIARSQGVFEIVALPRLQALSPAKGASLYPNQNVEISVRVQAGPTTIDPATLLSLGAVTATLESADESVQELPWAADGNRLSVSLPAPAGVGDYAVSFHLTGRTKEGLPFADTLRIPFSVSAPLTPTPEPETHAPVPTAPSVPPTARHGAWPWALVGSGIGGLALTGACCWALVRRAPRLEGQLRVLDAPRGCPAGYLLDLSMRRGRVRVGGSELPLSEGAKGSRLPIQVRAKRDPQGWTEVILTPTSSNQRGCAQPSGSVLVNDAPLAFSHALRDGDVIAVDGWRLRYENLGQAARRPARGSRLSHGLPSV